ncbi:membrane or secreted protein [Spirosoma taeanense]|uniref:Membrane or secreted protein n=1 Tax=Spirosoma taeanense TaxID=2735870 RepID=A0A6M5Y5W7_9BACT|nr:membrane or secreted protein [Spirosoma taeanense]QJW89205.1 membrane or secreted protein [Spirosoma taeanense]
MKAGWIVLLFAASVGLALRPVKTDLDGAWRATGASGSAVVLTIMDNYLMQTTYEPNRFIGTRGGVCQRTGDKLNLTVEFDSQDSSRVGQTESYQVTRQNGQLILQGPAGNRTFSRLDEPTSQMPLAGLWRITGRANDAGQLSPMQRGPRKTLKLLTGGRFQWVAINPQAKQFSGTGGGTYVLKDGQYAETIDFFSRDNSRVGRSLTFNAEVNGSEWHHTGQSSTGSPVNEIWSREQ